MSREQEICTALINSDSIAIRYIMADYGEALYGVAFQILKSEALAQDAFQEGMVKVWKHSAGYDKSKGRLFTWLINIVRNTAIDMYRSRAFQQGKKIHDLDNAVGIAGEVPNVDAMGVRELLLNIDEKYREVLELAYFRGFTHAEMVESTGLPLGTIKSRLRIGLRELRKEFEVKNPGISGAFLLLALTGGKFLQDGGRY